MYFAITQNDRSAHKRGIKIDTIHRILSSVLPVCGFLTRPLFFLSFWSTIPKEAARCGSFLPSLRASVPACVFAECMHHRISCKQICRNINRFRFTFEYLFYKLFNILFRSSFSIATSAYMPCSSRSGRCGSVM